MMDKAMSRAMEMMNTPWNQLPPLAISYAHSLCKKLGMCGEVYLTAFAAYAQCVEGLECDDDGYTASKDAVEWFAERADQIAAAIPADCALGSGERTE